MLYEYMRMGKGIIDLDRETKQIFIYGAEIEKVNQDSLGRVHITVHKQAQF